MTEIKSTATVAEAELYRSEGNEHFRSFRYHNAIKSYTRSLECYETSAVLANRAQAYLNTKQYERALMDSARALELDANNTKAVFRYAKALKNLRLYEIAAEKISKIDSINPKNKEIAELKRDVQCKANCAELKLLCGNKDEFLRSKIPLMEIRNIEIVKTKSADQIIQKKLFSTESLSLEIPPPPTTSFIFISDFHKLKDKPRAFAKYFLSIDKDLYGELLDDIIETEMVKCLILGFDDLADESNIPQLLECLIKLTSVSRIDIAMLFLDEATKNVIRKLLDRYAVNEKQLSILYVLYGL
ncbi:TPR repeat family protein [Acanthocheilonema viteae]